MTCYILRFPNCSKTTFTSVKFVFFVILHHSAYLKPSILVKVIIANYKEDYGKYLSVQQPKFVFSNATQKAPVFKWFEQIV